MSALAAMDADKAAIESAFGQGFDYTDHDEARAAIAELICAERAFDDASQRMHFGRYNYACWEAARERRRKALIRVQGGTQ